MDNQARKNEKVRLLLQREVAEKSAIGSIAFFLFGILVFFYAFKLTEYLLLVRILTAFIIVNAVFRFSMARKYMKEEKESIYRIHKVAVLLNGFAWGVIFFFSAKELNFTGQPFVVMVLILTAFTSSSLSTLSYDKWLYFPFQCFMILPLAIFAFIQGHVEMGIIMTFGFMYQVRAYSEFNKPLTKRFHQTIELEDSNESLRISQTALINQTTKLIHTSRLAALGEMARGLSHEINNSLMSIIASTDLIERNLKKENTITPKLQNGLLIIRDSVKKTAGVVEGLRFFSLEKDAEKKENVLLDEVLDKSLSLSQEMLKAHSVRLEITGNTELLVYCRTVQIAQILFTVIQNAYEAQIEETDRWIRIEVGNTKENIFLGISNGGKKISEEVAMKLFQPFFTTKDIGMTTGLSLSIARGIANEHGGDLYLDRTREHTTFVLKLPMLKPLSLDDEVADHVH